MTLPVVAPAGVLKSDAAQQRRWPVGAEYAGGGQTHFRVWAPAAVLVQVVFEGGREHPLDRGADGYFSGLVDAPPGSRYQFRVNRDERPYPDPASRFQPEGPHSWSEVVDPRAFTWTDQQWKGVTLKGQVIYELHVGTFTPAGTWRAAAEQLSQLASLGVTVVEVMPIAEFDGRFGWGYDGVDLWAPSRRYGRPDDLRWFIDCAHGTGIGVILDVVYNHFGPSGNYLRSFSPTYFSTTYDNEWGDAINFDGADSAPVREFFTANAGYWIDEFHFDGLRLDATQQIYDRSPEHILASVGEAARRAANGRPVIVVAENEPQDTRLVRPRSEGGYGLDGLWNDDFHHSATVALTGQAEAYYSDTTGTPQELISAAKYGYLFQGQHYHWQKQPRGTPSWGVAPWQFITFLENHDQIANAARGLRPHVLASPGKWRAMTALLLLMPGTPMLFQGQEFASSSPFLYFADHEPELADAVRRGRIEFLRQFPSIAGFFGTDGLDDPSEERTFARCRLDFSERTSHAEAYRLHRDLLKLRRQDPAFSADLSGGLDGAVLSDRALALRFFTQDGNHQSDRVLIVNLGPMLARRSFAEPLLAPPDGSAWALLWSSADPKYGGGGTPNLWPDQQWLVPGECAVVLGAGGPRPEQPVVPIRRRTA